MTINLTAEQETFINTKLQTGKYSSVEEILEIALQLLEEYERSDAKWVEDVKVKIDAAITIYSQSTPLDGEEFVSEILELFQAQKKR